MKGDNADVNVKRLPKRPVPPRFGRKLTAAQRETATHICVDCGWIYFQKAPFDSLPDEYQCALWARWHSNPRILFRVSRRCKFQGVGVFSWVPWTDCDLIYFQKAPFDSLPDEYQCTRGTSSVNCFWDCILGFFGGAVFGR